MLDRLSLTSLAVVFSISCHKPAQIDPFDERLVVITRNAPTAYLFDKDGQQTGFEHDLVMSFAKSLGREVEYVAKDSTDMVLEELGYNRAHFAAAGLTRTSERENDFNFGPNYLAVEHYVVCQPRLRVLSTEDLPGKTIVIPSQTSYSKALRNLKPDLPSLEWSEQPEESTENLLAQVDRGELDCTVADSHIFKTTGPSLPDLRVNFSIGNTHFLAWPFSPRAAELQGQVQTWFEGIHKSGELASLIDRYFGPHLEFDYYDIRVFRKRIKTVLPKYETALKKAANANGLSFPLLAAIAYQESHWNPNARSRTGVRGFMMLTRATAKELGVKNRLNAQQSINGGALYLRKLIDRLPRFIDDRDRTWMALAAYNIGFGHLQDARRLTIDLGKNPNSWIDLQKVLPLLTKPKYYKKTRFGYARGYEPVAYIRRIRQYLAILPKVDVNNYKPDTKAQ